MALKHTAEDRVARMKTFGRKVRAYFRTQAEVKACYAMLDELEPLIVGELQKAKNLRKKFSKRQAVVLVDNYVDAKTGLPKLKVWKAHGISRWTIDTVDLA